jgi:hypothetical protein
MFGAFTLRRPNFSLTLSVYASSCVLFEPCERTEYIYKLVMSVRLPPDFRSKTAKRIFIKFLTDTLPSFLIFRNWLYQRGCVQRLQSHFTVKPLQNNDWTPTLLDSSPDAHELYWK